MMTHAVDTLLDNIYQCSHEPAHWRAILDDICARVGARSAVAMVVAAPGDSTANWLWCEYDSHSAARQSVFDSVIRSLADNLPPSGWDFPRRLESLPPNWCASARDPDLFPRDGAGRARLERTLETLDLGPFLGTGIVLDQSHFIALALRRSRDDRREFSSGEERFIQGVMPHLRRSLLLSQRLARSQQRSDQLEAAFRHLRTGVLLCGSDGRGYWANDMAARLLDGRYGLRLMNDRLVAEEASMRSNLRDLMAKVAAGRPSDECGSLLFDDGSGRQLQVECKLQLTPAPLATSHAGRCQPHPIMWLLTERNLKLAPEAETLQAAFGLTPAEARLVAALCAGMSVKSYAEQRGITVGTARYQLQQVFAKTATSSQAQLVRLGLLRAAEYI